MTMQDNDKQQNNTWPLPKFNFELNWDDLKIAFQEVSGLETEAQSIEYRHGDSPLFSTIKMPGIHKFGNITLKQGMTTRDTKFLDWYNQIKMNTIKRRELSISLLDETGAHSMVWTVTNAWVIKITGVDLSDESSEVALDYMEIAHEGIGNT
jgi:phage tail-like protein